jgi:hypothetical protein
VRRDEITVGQRVRVDLHSEVRYGRVVDIRHDGRDAYGNPTPWDILVHTERQERDSGAVRGARTAWYPAGRILPATVEEAESGG